MSKRVAEIVVDALQQAGVRRCYGIVGDTLNHVTDAMHGSEIAWVHVRHEEVAAFAAGADSLVSGELTACAGSCGPGGLHFINGVFESNRNRAPMVLIASQVVTSELGMEFPQEVDFKSVYGSCTVFCEQVHSPEQARLLCDDDAMVLGGQSVFRDMMPYIDRVFVTKINCCPQSDSYFYML